MKFSTLLATAAGLQLAFGAQAQSGSDRQGAAAAQAKPSAASPAPPAAASFAPRDNQYYAIGALLSHDLEDFDLTEAEFAQLRAGLADGFHHTDAAKKSEQYLPQVQALQRTRAAQVAERQKRAGEAYLAKLAVEPGMRKTTTGLLYKELVTGTGATPTPTDVVKVKYEGRLVDGSVFDSSARHQQVPVIPVNGVIPCWAEALQLMKVGGKSHIACPASLAYGERGASPLIRPGSTLDFDIELVSIEPPQSAGAAGDATLRQDSTPSAAAHQP